MVLRRVTKRKDTEETIEDLDPQGLSMTATQGKFPGGPLPIITTFYYRGGGKQPSRVQAVGGDPNVYEVPGGHMVYDRFVQYHKGTKRPLNIWPEIWATMTQKQKNIAISKWDEQLKSFNAELYQQNVDEARAKEMIGGGSSSSSSSVAAPAMPTKSVKDSHRQKIGDSDPIFNACVARPVGKAEIAKTPAAQAALDKEWKRLVDLKTWDENRVEEWGRVAARHRQSGTKAHIGRVFELCVEKGSEMAEGNPARKYKGRSVYQGNQVKDEHGLAAVFEDLGSSPAAMESSKILDFYGLINGNHTEIADATQAYCQAHLQCKAETWVRLPKDRWPKSWAGKFIDPVVPLRLALYGHPESGGWWERHLEKHLFSEGWKPVPEWRSTYFRESDKTLLAVYVDDFKLSGPATALKKAWSDIRKGIVMNS